MNIYRLKVCDRRTAMLGIFEENPAKVVQKLRMNENRPDDWRRPTGLSGMISQHYATDIGGNFLISLCEVPLSMLTCNS